MGFLRVMLVLLVALVALYLVLSVTLRLSERARLAREWDLSSRGGDRADFVREGMAAYDRSLRKRLLWGVIVGPLVGVGVLLYLLNIS
jgi:Ca2+/Na+ antiporter